jgi:hypothetical protein
MVLRLVLGAVALIIAWMLWAPPSRELVIKLGTLLEWAQRTHPELYAARLAPLSPFVGKAYKPNKLMGVLRADMTEFGEVCVRLQREARKLDRKAHYAVIPIAVYLIGLGVWYALR